MHSLVYARIHTHPHVHEITWHFLYIYYYTLLSFSL